MASARCKTILLRRPLDDQKIPHIRNTQFTSQPLIELLLRLRNRTETRQIRLPECRIRPYQRRMSQERPPPGPATVPSKATIVPADGPDLHVRTKPGRDHDRKNPSSDATPRCTSPDEQRGPVAPRRESRPAAGTKTRCRWSARLAAWSARCAHQPPGQYPAGVIVTEQMNRIIVDDAQERHAESERDAVDKPEPTVHRHHAGQDPARQRNQTERTSDHRSIAGVQKKSTNVPPRSTATTLPVQSCVGLRQ